MIFKIYNETGTITFNAWKELNLILPHNPDEVVINDNELWVYWNGRYRREMRGLEHKMSTLFGSRNFDYYYNQESEGFDCMLYVPISQ